MLQTGSVVYYSASPPYVHRVVNIGTGAVRIVDVELSGAVVVPTAAAVDDTVRHVVEIVNEHVRVSRVRLGPGESLPAHTHPRGWLDVMVTAEPGKVAWRDAGVKVTIAGQAGGAELVEIEPR